MTREEIIAFKNEARNYKFYHKQIYRISDKIDELQYQLNGVHGVSFEERAHTTNPEAKQDVFFRLLKKKDELIIKKGEYQKKIASIENVIKVVEDYEKINAVLIRKVLLDGRDTRSVGDEIGFTHTAVVKRIDSALSKVKNALS